MKSFMKWTALAGLVTAAAFAVFAGSATRGGDVQAAGVDRIGFEFGVTGGTIPAAGSTVGTTIQVFMDNGYAGPSRNTFFDFTFTSNTRTNQTVGPNGNGALGTPMPSTAIGARAGTIAFTIQTNVILALAGSPCGLNCPNSGPLKGLVPECGDNIPGNVTVDWTGNGSLTDDAMLQATTTTPFKIHTGNMTGYNVFVDSVFDWDGIPAEENKYAHAGGPLIQTYDDDNNNGIPDSKASDTAPGKAEDTVGADPADPWANANGARTAYQSSGAPEDQEDDDNDGLPNGIEKMPDFLPLVAKSLGLETKWASRTLGIAEALGTAAAPTSVSFLAFKDIPSVGSATATILTNPFAPATPSFVATCAPFTSLVSLDATSSVTTFTDESNTPVGITGGDAVTVVTNDAAGASTFAISDGSDYDLDGLVAGSDKCPLDTDNTDADGDRMSGACDPTPGVLDSDAAGGAGSDYDGDGFKNNTDNCPLIANPGQIDADSDGAGDNPYCDPFVTVDTITGLVSGQGNGGLAALVGTVPPTTSAIDNDRVCVDSILSGVGAAEPTNDGPGMGTCTPVVDASDDGTADSADSNSDEDGDGCPDNNDANNYNPLVLGTACGLTGTRAVDYDMDGCSNAEELGGNAALGGKKNPLSWWDHFDVNGDQVVDLSDTLDVLGYFGDGGTSPAGNARDRALPIPSQPEDIIPSDDGVDLTDALNTLAQFGFGCVAGDSSLTQIAPTDGSYIGQ